MHERPLFSIIIPTFNAAATLGRCLDSIASQTFRDVEVLIQDGLSADRTVDVAKDAASFSGDLRFILRIEKDTGVYDAMNRARSASSGEWILFLGADDRLHSPTTLSRMADRLSDVSGDLVYGDVAICGNREGTFWSEVDGDRYDGPFSLEKLCLKNICHQSIFYRRSLFDRLGDYDLRYSLCADWDFNLRCFSLGTPLYVDEVIADFSTGGISSSRRADRFMTQDIALNIVTYFGLAPTNPLLRYRIDQLFACSRHFVERKQYVQALQFAYGGWYHRMANRMQCLGRRYASLFSH